MVRHLLDPAQYRMEVSTTGMLVRTLVRVGLTRGRPAPESPTAPAPEVVPWIAPMTAAALGRASE